MKKLGGIGLLLLLAAGVWVNSLRPAPNVKAREAVWDSIHLTYGDIPSKSKVYWHSYINRPRHIILMIPSAGREASDFNELAKELKGAHNNLFLFDPRGLHNEPLHKNPTLHDFAEPITDFTSSLGAQPPKILIGHAYGNRVVRMATYQNPENVRGVILLAAGGQVSADPEADAALKRVFNPLKSYRSRMKDIQYAFFADGNDIPPHWKRGWHTKTAIAQGKAKGDGDDSWHCAGGVPMLIVQPMQDKIAPPANAYALKEKCPQEVEIVEVQNAGHALLPEQPEAVAKAVLDFLAKHHPTDKP